MSDPIEDRARQIEALVGEAASVAHRYKMKGTGSSHLLYVIAGTEEGRRIIEDLNGNPRRIRSFLSHAFEQNAQRGLAAGGTEIEQTIHIVVRRVINQARQNGRVPQLSDIIQEMTFLGEKCLITRQALIVGGVIETMPNRIEDDFDFEDGETGRFDKLDADITPFDEKGGF